MTTKKLDEKNQKGEFMKLVRNKKNLYSLWPVLGLLETFLETVLFLPELHDLLLLRGEVNGLRHWLHHVVCKNVDDKKKKLV